MWCCTLQVVKFTCPTYSDGVVGGSKTKTKKAQAMPGFRKTCMQPYQHINVNGNRGVLTFCVGRCGERFVVPGASCQTSVTVNDGAVISFVVVPKNSTETVAVVMTDGNKIVEAFLLKVTLNNGKAEVDLRVPYGGSPGAIGQMIAKETSCCLRVIKDGETLSESWSVEALKSKEETDSGKFSKLCGTLVGADTDQFINVELLNADGTSASPPVIVRALCVGPIEESLGMFSRLVSVCPGQGVAFERQTLSAHWYPGRDCRWVVDHPCN